MKRRSLAAAASLCLLLFCAAAPEAASAKETWTTVRSKNFFLIGNASDKEIRRVATKLEQFRDVFTRLFPAVKFNNPVPTTVVVFKSDGAYKPYKPVVDGKVSDVAGYFQSGEDVNYITLAAERTAAQDPFEVIYHEYVHLLVNNNLAAVPPWFNEGLAEYYSTFDVDDERKVYLGKLITNHLLLLRRQQQFIPLKTLFEIDYHSLHRNRKETKGLFYAQAWALVHYLVVANDGRRLPQLIKFLDLARGGKGQEEQAFREAFGTDYAGMEKELKGYVRGNDFQMRLVTFEQKLEYDAGMQSAPLSESDALAYLGDLLLHTNRPDEAAAKLREALALAPDSAAAHASLGMALVRQNRTEDAREHLRRAVLLDSRNYLAHYYYAYALSRAGMDAAGRVSEYDEKSASEMRAALAKAIELRPDFAESYRLLAFVNLAAGERLEESVALLKRAMTFAPGREEYLYILAQLYLRQEKYDEARAAAESLASAPDPQLRADAQSLLRAVEQMREQAARFKAMSEREAAGASRDEDEDEDAADLTGGDNKRPPRLRRLDEDEDAAPPDDGRSPEERQREAFSDALNDALRKPLAGETRASGALTRIECDARGLVFHVRSGERALKLTAANFDGLYIMAYTQEAGSTLTCGARKDEARVVVTYSPSKESRAKADGALAALEFVPAGFTLKQ